MKKSIKITGIIGIIGSLILLTPYIMGWVVKNEFYHLISDLNSPNQFEIQVIEYRQGWFSSVANVQYTLYADKPSNIGLDTNNQAAQPFQFVLQEKIHHGPVIFLRKNKEKETPSSLIFARALVESDINDQQYPITARTIIQLDGRITTNILANKIANSLEQAEGMSFVLQKLNGNFDLNPKQKDSQGYLNLESMDLMMKNTQLKVKNIHLNYKLNRNATDIWAGKRNINIDKLFIDTPDNKQIVLEDFKFNFTNTFNEPYMGASMNANLGSAKIDGKNYGAQAIEFTIDKLDAKSLSDIQKHVNETQQQNIPLPILFTQFYQLGMNLLSKGFVFDLSRFSLNYTAGVVVAKAHVELKAHQDPFYSPFQLLEGLSATAFLQIPKTLLEEIVREYYNSSIDTTSKEKPKDSKTRIKEWVDAGWLKLEGNDYQLNLKFDQQKLLINDKLIPSQQNSVIGERVFPDALAMTELNGA